MAAPDRAVPRTPQPPDPQPQPSSSSRKWGMDEVVVAAFAFLGVGGAVFLPLHFGFARVPPIVVSFLLATGLAALTYRFLGGIEGSSFSIGALKLTGSLAALVGIALVVNSRLTPWVQPAQIWEINGSVVLGRGANDQMAPTDFVVFPAAAVPAPTGDFHLRFIVDPENPPYLTIGHGLNAKGVCCAYGPVTIPLEPQKLKQVDPTLLVRDKKINLKKTVTLPPAQATGAYKDAAPLTQANPAQLSDYQAATQSTNPPAPGSNP